MAITHLGYWIAFDEVKERLKKPTGGCRFEDIREAYEAFHARPNAEAETAAVDAEVRRRAAMGWMERVALDAAVKAAVAARWKAAVRIQRAVRKWRPEAEDEAYCRKMADHYRKMLAQYSKKVEVFAFKTELRNHGLGDLEGFAWGLRRLDIMSLWSVENRKEELLRSGALENVVGFTPGQTQRLMVAADEAAAVDKMKMAAFCKARREEVAAEKAAAERREARWREAFTRAAFTREKAAAAH